MFTRTVSLRIVEAIEKFSPNLFYCFSVCVPSVADGGPSVVNTEKMVEMSQGWKLTVT